MRSDMQIPAIGRTNPLTETSVPSPQTPELSASGQLDFLVHRAMVIAGASGAAIALEADGEIVCRARSGNAAPDIGAILDRSSGISGYSMTVGEAVICSDAELDERVNAAACQTLGVRSILVCPLKKSGKVIGVLEILAREPGAVTPATTRKLDPVIESVLAIINAPEPGSDQKPKGEIAALGESNSPSVHPQAMETFLAKVESDSHSRWARLATGFLLALVIGLFIFFVARAVLLPRRAAESASTTSSISSADLRRAAELGDPSAQYALGVALQKGDGIKQDAASGARWLEVAAKSGHANAQYEFANALMEGKGVTRDMVEACAWFTVAAFSGKPVSEAMLSTLGKNLSAEELARVRHRLGQMFAGGIGVPQDDVAAYAWLSLSEAAGYAPARRDKAALASEMTRQQITEAKKRAAEWLDSEHARDAAAAQSR